MSVRASVQRPLRSCAHTLRGVCAVGACMHVRARGAQCWGAPTSAQSQRVDRSAPRSAGACCAPDRAPCREGAHERGPPSGRALCPGESDGDPVNTLRLLYFQACTSARGRVRACAHACVCLGVLGVHLGGGTWVDGSVCVCQSVRTYLVRACVYAAARSRSLGFCVVLVLWVQMRFYKWCGVLTCSLSSRYPRPGGSWPQEG